MIPAIFLDRDGTLVDDPGYLADPAGARLLPGVADALVAMADRGYLRIVVTNQSGIDRGLLSRAQFDAVNQSIVAQLGQQGAEITAIYCCPHRPEAGCTCRKPGTALHREAAARYEIELARSWCVGDHLRDVEPAMELGSHAFLVSTGQGFRHTEAATARGIPVCDDLAAGIPLLPRYLGVR